MGFFELLKGYDDDLTHEFSMELHSQGEENATTIVRGLSISLSLKTISRVSTLPLRIRWRKKDKVVSVIARKNFFISKENPIEDKNGVRREILPCPCDELACHILKYKTCEGRLSVVYAYHFRFLHELRFKAEVPLSQRLSVPHFIIQTIMEMSQKVREGKH